MARRRLRIKTRFYVVLALVLIAVTVTLALSLGKGRAGTLGVGSIRLELDATAVIVRDEMSISVDKYDRVEFECLEGETVSSGMAVARVFKWNYSDEMMQSLLSVESEIYGAQKQALEGIENADLDNIELSIDNKRREIRSAVMDDDGGNLLTLENELEALLVSRAEHLKGVVQPDEALNILYTTQAGRSEQMAEYRSEVTAMESGVVSFYFDGFEQALNADKLDMVNAALVQNVIKGAKGTTGGAASGLLYRLVKPDRWYIAFVTARNEALRTATDETYTVVFEGYADRPYSAHALSPVIYDDGVVNVLEFSEDIGPLLSARKVKITLKLDASGIEVPLHALTFKDGVASLSVYSGNTASPMEVEVVSTNGEYAIVKPKNPEDTLLAGQRYEP